MAESSNPRELLCTEEDEYKEVTVELDQEEGGHNKYADCTLVGKILADKILNKGAVKSIITKAWGNPKELKISVKKTCRRC